MSLTKFHEYPKKLSLNLLLFNFHKLHHECQLFGSHHFFQCCGVQVVGVLPSGRTSVEGTNRSNFPALLYKESPSPCFLRGPSTGLPYVDGGPHRPRWGCRDKSGTSTHTDKQQHTTHNNKQTNNNNNKRTNIHMPTM